jgi:hypothetical protein
MLFLGFFILKDGCTIRFREVQRTPMQQAEYLRTGASKTMNSEHLNCCAGDLIIERDGVQLTRDQIKPYGDYWESLDPRNRWGGNWRGLVDAGRSKFIDAPHFERRTV